MVIRRQKPDDQGRMRVMLSLDPDEYKILRQLAKINRRNMSQQMVHLLLEEYRRMREEKPG